MNIFRLHITKRLLITTVWMGMILYLLNPVQDDTASSSFANWLDTVVKNSEVDSDNIRQQLFKLRKSDDSLNTVIQKASELVSQHNEGFDLPLDEQSTNSKKIYDVLIWEWNSYQTGNGMGKASLPTTIKSNLQSTLDKYSHSFYVSFSKQVDQFSCSFDRISPIDLISQQIFHVIPLSGGMAIGAP